MNIDNFIASWGGARLRHSPDRYKNGIHGSMINRHHPIVANVIRSELYQNDLITIKDELGNDLAILCLMSGKSIFPSVVSDIIYAAYINDLEGEIYGEPYTFKYNHLVVLPNMLRRYYNEYNTDSLIWGGFSIGATNSIPQPSKRTVSEVHASKNTNPKHSYQYDLIALAESQPFSFERYLRYYHCFEYIFEWQIVEKIRSTNSNLDGYTNILKDLYKREELDRLKMVLKRYISINDAQEISSIFSVLCRPDYMQTAKDIFFDYGKDSNPIKDVAKFERTIINHGFSPAGLLAESISNQNNVFIDFIVYCIYRMRCSIAHTKLSEYVIKPSDEPFVADFGEPLIRFYLKKYFQT